MNQATQFQSPDDAAVFDLGERYANDARLFVTFYRGAVINPQKSAEAGRPIFDEEDFCRIVIPGDRYTTVEQKVQPSHKHRFTSRWERYQKGLDQAHEGTPLEHWPQMTVGMVATLKARNIYTVEDLAEMADALASGIHGFQQLKARAKTYLEAAKGEAVNTKMAAELEKRDAAIADLTAKMEAMIQAQRPEKEGTVSNALERAKGK